MIRQESGIAFHHALRVLPDRCTGCTHCMKACPTEAIRVRNGLAEIFEDRCVDCGECHKACPVSAIIVEQDDFDEIYKYEIRVALLPSVLIGQFPSNITTDQIFDALRKLGFTHIFEIDSIIDIVQEGYDKIKADENRNLPLISSFCPAIVRLIQVKFPGLVDNLALVKPPSDIAAIYIRDFLAKSGQSSEKAGLFYITPCAAKIASIKSPVGENNSPVNGVINMEYLYNRLMQIIHKGEKLSLEEYTNHLSAKGVLWSLTRGEARHQSGRSLAIDGMSNVSQFLERLEESEESNIDFLELRACDESCAGGILISGNRFLTVERMNRRARDLDNAKVQSIDYTYETSSHKLSAIPARSMLTLSTNREKAIEMLKKRDELLKILPGIDCAACGAPGCKALAGDIVRGEAELSSCIFIQELYIRKGKLTLEKADRINTAIWGERRDKRSLSK